jgi:hypothetical protein
MKSEKKENKEKECFKIVNPEILESLLASGTWRPGKARPPLSTAREAWLKCMHNSWVKNLIFLGAGSGFSFILTSSQAFGGYTVTGFILAVGAGVVSGALVLGGFFIAFCAKEVYARRK